LTAFAGMTAFAAPTRNAARRRVRGFIGQAKTRDMRYSSCIGLTDEDVGEFPIH
jgi:hypothetical protein